MKTIFKNGYILMDGELVLLDFIVENQKFIDFGHSFDEANARVVDMQYQTILPGLFDIHTHGSVGYDYNIASLEDMEKIIQFSIQHGITSVFPTVMTDDEDIVLRQLSLIDQLSEKYDIIKGIHLEGPFLSKEFIGAMNPNGVMNASIQQIDKFQNACHHKIKMMTISPETLGVEETIPYLIQNGVMVSLGHSQASYEEAMRAIELGARSFTHTFNAMKPLNHHQPSIVGAALASDAFTELICDGFHLHPDIIRMMKKIKGMDKLLLVTDSIMACGLPDGNYHLGKDEVIVEGGDAHLIKNGARAGSTLDPFSAIKNFARFNHLKLYQAVPLMSKNPAEVTGLNNQVGEIKKGLDADFIVVNNDELISVYSKGVQMY